MIKASVYIICQNEERHIRRSLESVKDFDEVVVVDSGSTDRTLDIVKEYTEKVFYRGWSGFADQKQYAKSLCTNDWVLNLDADEELTPELKAEIEKTLHDNEIDGLDIRISSRYLGRFNRGGSKFNRRVRFFRKQRGNYPEKLVHESIVVDGEIRRADGFILDYGTLDIATHIKKINEYSSLRAEEKHQRRKSASIVKLLLVFPLAFVKSYIVKRGFLNGVRGYIAAMNNAFYAFLKEAKLFEKSLQQSSRSAHE